MSVVVSLAAFRDLDRDPDLPTLAQAIDPPAAQAALAGRLPRPAGMLPPVLRSIRVVAYKPRRRCLVEYTLDCPHVDGSIEQLVVIGKIRANRFGNAGYRQLRALRSAGFDANSRDGISVPRPVATVPAFRMWLQEKIDGAVAAEALNGPDGVPLAHRIAAAAHKLHTRGPAPERRHTMADELRILEWSLARAGEARPELAHDAARLSAACERLGLMLPDPAWCPSHRDFYADQVLVSGDRLFLLDFDLYCEADPGLDIGNFIGHVAEQGLRLHGSVDALVNVERALEDRFVALAGGDVRWPVRVYTALTLARHVYLSTRFADRGHLTSVLIAAASERLGLAAAEGGYA